MASSMNPVDLYRDTSLDGLIDQKDSIRRHSSGHRRNNTQDRWQMAEQPNGASRPPPAPEAPRGPPISYRNNSRDDPGLQRSFSQRAKGRPFAREAFADEEDLPNAENVVSKDPSYVLADRKPQGTRKLQKTPPSDLRVKTVNLNGNATKRVSSKEVPPASAPIPTQAAIRQRPRQISDTSRHANEPISALSRSSAMRDTSGLTDDQRRDWAPDRSPLQKLEVTLNDISKEEKRARVQEAEMLLQEAKAGRLHSRTTQSKIPTPREELSSKRVSSAREPQLPKERSTVEGGNMVRNLSATQRDRLQHSTTVDTHKPDTRRLSGEGQSGFEYENKKPQHSSPAAQKVERPNTKGKDSIKQSDRQKNLADSKKAVAKQGGQQPAHSTNQTVKSRSVASGVPSNITQAVSMQQYEPEVQFADDDNEPYDEDGEPLYNNMDTPVRSATDTVNRSGSRKLQKAPPIEIDRSRPRKDDVLIGDNRRATNTSRTQPHGPGAEYSQGAVHRPVDVQGSQSQRNRTPVGLGLQGSSQPDSPNSPMNQQDAVRSRQRKSSVSFKEPATRRPNDEWKEAGIARLALADFVLDKPAEAERSKTWWEQGANPGSRRSSRGPAPSKSSSYGLDEVIDDRTAEFTPRLFLRCGPLLRYTGMKRTTGRNSDGPADGKEIWRGTVMIVTQDSQSSYESPPILRIFAQPKRLLPPPPAEVAGEELAPEYIDPIAGLTKLSRTGRIRYVRPVDHLEEGRDLSLVDNDGGLFESSPSPADINGNRVATLATTNNRTVSQDGERVGRYQEVRAARLYADPERDVTFWRFNIEVELSDLQQHIAYRINRGPSVGFWVPARGQSMNIMFHSCNGFSLSVNPHQFSGPDPLWRDVLNTHQTRPFHVMLGGGDQIYNDRVVTETRYFGEWTKLKNPQHKHHAPFSNEMKEELETFYLNRYAMWFSQGLFGMANSQIPMVNIWDDHDIIDGFGSYPDHFMSSPVFSGIGNVAFKYYMLFQHHSVPEETTAHEPSWVLGHEHGPYIRQLSRSVFMHLGKSIAFLGLDCRTERMRDEILSSQTLDLVLERCRKEIVEGETKHLIVLLGVPIAYPRLVWLENVLTSRAMDPVKALGRAGILKGGFLNKFDGGVEILDDLDDHWTASHHKHERNDLVKDLQDLAAEKSVRITILGGDVHLAAVGQFHSIPKLKIPKDRDHRYMPNVISSAIVNTPPPDMMADILNRRNKTHHLDKYTDENMIPMFTHDVDHKKRNNKNMLPRRNWCSIREYIPGSTPPPTPPDTPSISGSEDLEYDQENQGYPKRRFSFSREDVNPRALLRRLSSRNAPPTSYRDTMDPGNRGQLRPASFDGTQQNGYAYGTHGNASGSQSQSINSSGAPERRASSFDHTSSGAPVRPNMFLRRPTNISEKAARRGNIPAIDAEGNEFDVNDHINLEGGLDIELNVEVNQRDPAGITIPYRLLVPALWYDGSSDREKLEEAGGVMKRPTLLNRLSLTGRRGHRAGQNQGSGNWGQEMSDVESHSGSEDVHMAPPRRRFSLFGNMRRKKEPEYYDSEEDDDYDEMDHAPQNTNRPPEQGANTQIPIIKRDASTANHQSYQAPRNVSAPLPTHDRLYDTKNPPPAQPPQSTMSQGVPPARRSLTIGSQPRPDPYYRRESESPVETYPSRPPQATYKQAPLPRSAYQQQAQFNSPPAPAPQRQLSKQERLLGMDPSQAGYMQQPPPQPLRGNGIIGKNYDTGMSPPSHSYDGSSHGPKGYSGVEAYQEPKPRRGFSLRAARNWLDGRSDWDGSRY